LTNSFKTNIEVVVPVADFRDVERNISRHAPRRGFSHKKALLLPSEKTSSIPFIEVLLDRMTRETEAARVTMQRVEWAFFHPGRNRAIVEEIDRLAAECDVMVTGVAY